MGEAHTRAGRTPAAARPAAGRRAAIATLAIGALLLAAGLAATLSHATVRRSGTNDVTVKGVVGTLRPGHQACQQELIPAGTAAVRVSADVSAHPFAPLAMQVLDLGTGASLAGGIASARPAAATTVTLHRALAHDADVRICLRLSTSASRAGAQLYGSLVDPQEPGATDNGNSLPGRIRLEYLRASRTSWWSFAPTVIERLGRGRAWFGSAAAAIVALLLLTSISAATWLLVRES